MKKVGILVLIIVAMLALFSVTPISALAQSYSFVLEQARVDVYLQPDGTLDVLYRFTFQNDPGAAWIDFVDIGLPDKPLDEAGIQGSVNGNPAAYVSSGEYEGNGTGVAVALGEGAIPPGSRGEVVVFVPGVQNMFHPDTQDEGYASMVFSPTWFSSDFVRGNTDMQVTFHLPPGVQPNEPRWHAAPAGWASEPQMGVDEQGRVTYTWRNGVAYGFTQYNFGASVPRAVLPAEAVKDLTLLERLNISSDALVGWLVGIGFFVIFASSFITGIVGNSRRKLWSLPPKITIEGHGIKRGLTAVEAAILMEKPLDRVLTMILFGVIRKGAAQVVSREPLELEAVQPKPEGLHPYEVGFLNSFEEKEAEARKKALQKTMIELIKSVASKMKGFSRKETVAYYDSIVAQAWSSVESAGTPEVRGARYEDLMDWTLLDKDADDRTRRAFGDEPVVQPSWWHRYEPVSSSGGGKGHASAGPGGGGVSLPTLPGSSFAASIVNGVQGFSAGVIGGLGDFTSGVTSKTNPAPVSSGGGSSGGGGCACACAGCACACAGGGR